MFKFDVVSNFKLSAAFVKIIGDLGNFGQGTIKILVERAFVYSTIKFQVTEMSTFAVRCGWIFLAPGTA